MKGQNVNISLSNFFNIVRTYILTSLAHSDIDDGYDCHGYDIQRIVISYQIDFGVPHVDDLCTRHQ